MGKDSSKGKKFFNDGETTVRSFSCPIGFVPGRLPFTRTSPSLETREKISKANSGKPSSFLGKTHSDSTRDAMSKAAKKRVAILGMPNNTGKDPWNKGKTKEHDPRILAYSVAQLGILRSGKYPKGEKHWNWKDSETYTKPFYHYSKEVWRLTRSTYNKNKRLINPNNYPRGRAGTPGAYQLDHKVSVHFGFMNNIPPAEIARIDNLQLLTWEENLLKSNKA